MSRAYPQWPVIIALSSILASMLVVADISSPVRSAVVLWFLLSCPGMALVRLLRLQEWVFELTLGIALSIALDTLVAGAMLYGGVWSPRWGVAFLACLSLMGVGLQVAASRDSGASRKS